MKVEANCCLGWVNVFIQFRKHDSICKTPFLSIPNILCLDLQKLYILCVHGKLQSKPEFSHCNVERSILSLGIASKSVSPLLDDSEDVDGAAELWLHSLQCEGKYGRNSGHLEATCGTLEFCEGFYKRLWAPKKEFHSVGNLYLILISFILLTSIKSKKVHNAS